MTRRTKLKIKINLKSPDAIHDAVREAAIQGMRDDLEGQEFRDVLAERMDFLFDGPLHKWIVYKECMTIEIDTVAGTATVLEQG